MSVAVKTMTGKRSKRGGSTRAARIRRLEERLAVERDTSIRESIEAQLRAFGRGTRS